MGKYKKTNIILFLSLLFLIIIILFFICFRNIKEKFGVPRAPTPYDCADTFDDGEPKCTYEEIAKFNAQNGNHYEPRDIDKNIAEVA